MGGRGGGGRGARAQTSGRGGMRGRGGRGFRRQTQRVDRLSSVKVSAEWRVIEEFDLVQLTKLSTKVPEVTDLVWAGELAQYNEQFDRASTRAEKPLQRMENTEFYYVTTTDDPAIEKFAEEGAGTVYGTDAIFSLLMATGSSASPNTRERAIFRISKVWCFESGWRLSVRTG